MKSALNLGSIFSIPLRLHYTWFIIFSLITVSLVVYLPVPGFYPLWQRIAFGLVTSLLFFASIVIHELAHSFVAVRNNIPVKSITLFVFGGVSQITKEATKPRTELVMSVVGPLSSLILASIFYGVSILLVWAGELLAADMVRWLAAINTLLAVFNLIPGFPLDGGRVFRSIIWMGTGNYLKATRIATLTGRIIGYLFIAGGVVAMFVTREWVSGLWLAFIGWFLSNAATASYRQALLHDTLSGLTARDVMIRDCPFISPRLSLRQLIQDYILPGGHYCFVVAGDSELHGVITIHNVKSVPQKHWDTISVEEVMVPKSELKIAYPGQAASNLLEQIEGGNINQMPVVEDGRVVGMITRDSLTRFLRTRADLGM